MSADEGNCAYCGVANSYDDVRCKSCGQELPWADWVRARGQGSSAIGGEAGSFAAPGGQDVKEGLPLLPPGALTKIFLVLAALVGFYLILNFVTPALHQASRGAGGANAVSAAPAGNIAEQFKKANPVLQQDRLDKPEETPR